jgi:hypothetical protein
VPFCVQYEIQKVGNPGLVVVVVIIVVVVVVVARFICYMYHVYTSSVTRTPRTHMDIPRSQANGQAEGGVEGVKSNLVYNHQIAQIFFINITHDE